MAAYPAKPVHRPFARKPGGGLPGESGPNLLGRAALTSPPVVSYHREGGCSPKMNRLHRRGFRRRRQCSPGVLAAVLLSALPGGLARAQHLPAAASPAKESPVVFARRQPISGVPNFAEVTPKLYRGARPTAEGFRNLKQLGVEIVVSLSAGEKETASEQRLVAALGMRYVGISWNRFRRPANRQVAQFLALVRANPEKKIFVHCRQGRDRTGVMVAAFRMAELHWSPEQALEEMAAFHFHSFWLHSWKSYVEGFPQQFSSEPSFGPLR